MLTHTQHPVTGQPCRETKTERERKWGDGVTAKSKRFWQNLRMTKLTNDRKLSKECEKKRRKKL